MKYISPKHYEIKKNFQLTHNVELDIRNFFKFISLYKIVHKQMFSYLRRVLNRKTRVVLKVSIEQNLVI